MTTVLSRLPPEIWLAIVRWATWPPSGFPASAYEPFRPSFDKFEELLKTKRAVVRVCRLWRALATSILYEDVTVRHGAKSLQEVLENECGPGNERGSTGRWVRRLELPYTQTGTDSPDGPTNALRILNSCTSLQTLVRPFMCQEMPDVVRYEFPAESVSLPSLTRLEWWHYNNAARSGGINSLTHVLRTTPSLQFLTVGGEFWMSSMSSSCASLRLPSLTTLRLWRVNALFVRLICQWDLPSLVHVVVDFPPDHGALEALWATFGHRLCTVELGRNIVFLMNEQTSIFLRGCPSVKIFNYFIYFTAIPQAQAVEHSSLQCVGIHAFPCAMMRDVQMEHLEGHFNFLASPLLPALRRVILYGEWRNVMTDQLFITFRDSLARKGCAIQIADGVSVPGCEYQCIPSM